MKLTIDQIPCDLDPSQRIALDYDAPVSYTHLTLPTIRLV